ncbi:SRPBCC family protein [Dongia sp.]|uniref:SRPBCC family protein n=1 Tax=Dongia sp. TaxID=1977262 RepID=UPI0035AEBA4C
MLKFIVIAIVVLGIAVTGFLSYAARKPDSFEVRRVVDIKAPPERIFPCINRLGAWSDWSAYETKDPDMERIFSGPPSGPGAVYEWEGDSNVGAGRMEILSAEPNRRVSIRLNFLRPFEAENMAEFTLEPMGETTRVTWVMTGPAPLLTKVMDTLFNMDRMIGADFEAGLANLKNIAEG